MFTILGNVYWLIGIAAGVYYVFTKLLKKNPYPPGPSGYPIIGNTFQVPFDKTWKYFEKVFRDDGPIAHLSLGGDDILLLSDPVDAEELLGRRSHNYSSRKPQIYAGKYQSNDKRFVFLSYGPRFKKHRNLYVQMLHPRAITVYEPAQSLESIRLLHDILTRPEEWCKNCKRFSSSLQFTLNYGRRVLDNDTDFDALLEMMDESLKDAYPGAHMVDVFPVLDYLPDFLSPWRAKARATHEKEMKLYGRLMLEVKQKMEQGMEMNCLASRLWKDQKELDMDFEEIVYIAGQGLEAGTDTAAATLQWCLVAIARYPEYTKKAQVEIDTVLGAYGTIMPTFEDIDRLPYCLAFMKEVFRWAPCIPTGFPHTSDADDEYKGYKVYANTMVIPCIWNIHHNERVYPDPYTFNPDRFLQKAPSESLSATLNDGHYGYGFGRRKCPGQYIASKSVWIAMTRLLWGFDISPGVDLEGKTVILDPEHCISGVTSAPIDVPLVLTPRSKRHVDLIKTEYNASF